MKLNGQNVKLAGFEVKEYDGKPSYYVRFLEDNGTYFESSTKDVKVFSKVAQIAPMTPCNVVIDAVTKVTGKGMYKSNELVDITVCK